MIYFQNRSSTILAILFTVPDANLFMENDCVYVFLSGKIAFHLKPEEESVHALWRRNCDVRGGLVLSFHLQTVLILRKQNTLSVLLYQFRGFAPQHACCYVVE